MKILITLLVLFSASVFAQVNDPDPQNHGEIIQQWKLVGSLSFSKTLKANRNSRTQIGAGVMIQTVEVKETWTGNVQFSPNQVTTVQTDYGFHLVSHNITSTPGKCGQMVEIDSEGRNDADVTQVLTTNEDVLMTVYADGFYEMFVSVHLDDSENFPKVKSAKTKSKMTNPCDVNQNFETPFNVGQPTDLKIPPVSIYSVQGKISAEEIRSPVFTGSITIKDGLDAGDIVLNWNFTKL